MAPAPLDFDALKVMQNSANDLLHSPMVQQALFHQREEKWVNDVSESSMRILEVCGISKDVLLLVKEHLQELQFTLRRASIGEPGIEEKITAYNCYRKKLKKETLKCLKWLKSVKSENIVTNLHPPMKEQKLTLVVDVLKEVRMTSISIVESLLSLVSTPWLDSKQGKRSFASKIMNMQNSDDDMIHDAMMLQSAKKRLAGVQMAIEDLEVELECMFRRLIHTRVLLLNILTNWEI